MSDQPSSRKSLQQVTLFAGLPAEALNSLAQLSPPRKYRKGQVFCLEGEPGNALFILEEGIIRVSQTLTTGEEALLAVVEAPAALGELALLDGAPRSGTLTAGSAVVVRTVPRPDFLQLLREQPATVLALLQTLAGIVRRTNERQVDLLTLDVPGRLAKWLIDRGESRGERKGEEISFQIGRNQSELAAELGTTRSTLNRTLHQFEDMGALEVDGEQVRILDLPRLREFTA